MTQSRRTFMKNAGTAVAAGSLGPTFANMSFAQARSGEITLTGSRTWKIGDIKCTALLDGIVQLDATIFSTADPDSRAALLKSAGQPEGKINVDVNAFLIETGSEKILVDSGTRDLFGPTLGKLPAQLEALGISADDIDKILLTHMHNDHTGGLTTGEGAAAYNNAELIVNGADWDFWTNDDIYSNASGDFKRAFAGARAALPAYRDRVRIIDGTDEVLSGIHAIALPGHSIGHSGFRLSSGKDQMIIWGDVVISPELQFAHPDWAVIWDADAETSIASRRRIFAEAAADNILVAGMHLPFPGVGYVTQKGKGFQFESAVVA